MSFVSGLVTPVDFALSFIIHILYLVPTIYITYLCALQDYSLFVWHPACLTIGTSLLMTEASLAISGEAFLVSKVSKAWRIRIHWILHMLGLGLVVIGIVSVCTYKAQLNWSHFKSVHAIMSLTGIVVSVVAALGGGVIMYTNPPSMGWTFRTLHVCFGIIAMILLMVAQITGMYTTWWPGSDIGRSLAVASYVCGIFLHRHTFVRGMFRKL